MTQVDIAVVVLYLSIVSGLGLYFAQRQKSTQDYFLAGRNIPGWIVGFSLMATIISSATFVGHSGNVFQSDMWHLPLFFTLPLVMFLVGRYLVVFYRHHLRMSVYEYLGHRFGPPAQLYGSLSFVLRRVVDMGVTFYFLSVAVSFLTDWDLWWVILIFGIFTLMYTLIGGISAVVWTDIIQGVLLIGGGLICTGVVFSQSGVSPGQLILTAWEGGRFGWGNWEFSLTENNIWLYVVGGFFMTFQSYATEQSITQRYLLARSDDEARRAARAGVLACLPVWVLFMILGALVWSFYEVRADTIPLEVVQVKDNVLPYFIKSQLPHGLIGLILATLLAAAMSSLDSDLNSVAAAVVQDVYCRFFPHSTDRQQLLTGRVVVIVAGLLSVWTAQQWIGIESFVRYSVALSAIISGGMLGLFGLGFLSRQANATGAYLGILVCVAFTSWATLTGTFFSNGRLMDFGAYNYPWNPLLVGILSHGVLFSTGFLTSHIFPRPTSE